MADQKRPNPFQTTTIKKLEDLIGYASEKKLLEAELETEGVTLLLSDEGYGKSSLLQVLASEGKYAYIERCTKLFSDLRDYIPLSNPYYRFFGDPTDVISKPVFIDECSAMTEEIASACNNMHDRGVKIVVSLTYDERDVLTKRPMGFKTLFDRVTKEIKLNGFAKEDVEQYIERNAGDVFTKEAREAIANKFRKPRDISRTCHNLWKFMVDNGKDKVTIDMIEPVKTELKTNESIGGKSQLILNYVQNNPGCKRGEIAKGLNISPNSVTNLLKIMMEKGLITRDGEFKHYASSPTAKG
jgi:Holliday junction resolvasome RuvABC ATP-dependent DNA helicase subunit